MLHCLTGFVCYVDRWIDMFDDFPSLSENIPLAAFVELCPIMSPRHYSIASSSWSKNNQVRGSGLRLATNMFMHRQLLYNSQHQGCCCIASKQPGIQFCYTGTPLPCVCTIPRLNLRLTQKMHVRPCTKLRYTLTCLCSMVCKAAYFLP